MSRRILMGMLFPLFLLSACIKEDDDIPDEIINYVGVGDKVPAFTVESGDGKEFDSSSFVGKRSLLALFVTTCSDCDRELPKAQAVWESLQGEDEFQVITIARKNNKADVDAYWKKKQFTMPVFLDLDRTVFDLFANSTVPRFYVIDEQGKVIWMGIETISLSAAEIEKKVRGE